MKYPLRLNFLSLLFLISACLFFICYTLIQLSLLVFVLHIISPLMLLSSTFVLIACAAVASASLTYKGADWSSVLVEEDAGFSYKTASGSAASLEALLASNGANTVRQRLWVNPSDGISGLNYNIEIAKRAQKQNLALYLDLHFSDTWADPGHQVGWLLNLMFS